jgi:hypothetical protein
MSLVHSYIYAHVRGCMRLLHTYNYSYVRVCIRFLATITELFFLWRNSIQPSRPQMNSNCPPLRYSFCQHHKTDSLFKMIAARTAAEYRGYPACYIDNRTKFNPTAIIVARLVLIWKSIHTGFL